MRIRALLSERRIGLAIEQDTVRGVVIQQGRILRKESIGISEAEPLTSALAALLKRLSDGGLLASRVDAAIGNTLCQVRRLTKLPTVGDPRTLTSLIRANPGRFFVQNGPLAISEVRVREPGECDAAAYHQSILQSLVTSCHESRAKLRLVFPSQVAFADSGSSARPVWLDERHYDVLKRALGEQAAPFKDALAAATCPARVSLCLLSREIGANHRPQIARSRLVVAGLACCVSFAVAIVGPVILARRQRAAAEARFRLLGDSSVLAQRTVRDLAAASTAISALEEFNAHRRSMTLLLGDLTKTLPDDVFLTTLHVDENGGMLTALAPRGGAVLSELQKSRMLTSATLVGSVTAEAVGTDRLERVSLRFAWAEPSKKRPVLPKSSQGETR